VQDDSECASKSSWYVPRTSFELFPLYLPAIILPQESLK
jgi:hypothetical protein